MSKTGGEKFLAYFCFIFGIIMLVIGILMIIFDIYKVGQHYLTTQQTAFGGELLIYGAIVSFIVGYYSLSPFSKIREFFEGKTRRKTPKKR